MLTVFYLLLLPGYISCKDVTKKLNNDSHNITEIVLHLSSPIWLIDASMRQELERAVANVLGVPGNAVHIHTIHAHERDDSSVGVVVKEANMAKPPASAQHFVNSLNTLSDHPGLQVKSVLRFRRALHDTAHVDDDEAFSAFWSSYFLPFVAATVVLIALISLAMGTYMCCGLHKKHPRKTKNGLYSAAASPELGIQLPTRVQPTSRPHYTAEQAAGATHDLLHTPAIHRAAATIKLSGLQERRGSNNSLTLDLNPAQELQSGTPPKECSTDEYLQTVGHRMSRAELSNCLNDLNALNNEFWDIPMNYPVKLDIPGAGLKNRYRTILPTNHSSVQLPRAGNDPLASYINANYIRGYEGQSRAYIATQGPMSHTVDDFWLMVWHELSSIIVMITKLKEKNKVKCELYLPTLEEEQISYGDIQVTVLKVLDQDGYTERHLGVKCNDERREVRHYWYTAWPDHRTPESARQLLELCKTVERVKGDSVAPTIVHCSAGIGRTGCFIATSIGMKQLEEENMVDVLGIVCEMRRDRGGLVQTNEQYSFVHKALVLYEKSLPSSTQQQPSLE